MKSRLETARATLAKAQTAAGKKPDDPKRIDALRRAERRVVKLEASARANAAIERRLDKISQRAPKVTARWKREREAEPKRIAQRKKALNKRTNRDTAPQRAQTMRAIGYSMAPTVQQPPLDPTPADEVVPPRAGVMAGDFKLIDDVAPPMIYRPPASWTVGHVGVRLIEAHSVLRRLPMRVWPQEYGANWPEYFHEGGELVAQASSGTLYMGRNRVRLGTSSDEVARMNEALAWPMEVFRDHPRSARSVNEWARLDPEHEDAPPWPSRFLQLIADHLNRNKVPVR